MKLVIQSMAHVWGGGEKFLVTLAHGLKARGHDVPSWKISPDNMLDECERILFETPARGH